MMLCSLCPYASYARGYCKAHYRRWVAHGDPLGGGAINRRKPVILCQQCERPQVMGGYCKKHYDRWKKHGDPRHGPDAMPPIPTREEIMLMPSPVRRYRPTPNMPDPTLANLLTAYKRQGRGSISIGGPLAGQRVLLSLLIIRDCLGGNLSHTELRAFAERGSCEVSEPWLREIAAEIGLTIETTAASPNMLTARGHMRESEAA